MKYLLALLLTSLAPGMAAERLSPTQPLAGSDATRALTGAAEEDPYAQVKRMGRGVNVLGYDPIWRDFGRGRFKERHFEIIRRGGFQTIRVNLHAFDHMNAQNELEPAWLKTLDWVVQTALTNGLNVILDEHDFNRIGRDANGGRPKLLAFWKQLAERYRKAPPGVLFEILNEPNGQLTDQLWNSLLKEVLSAIRTSNPTRNVIIGPASWNSINNLTRLELPPDDRHLIVTVHYYLPMEFTHQGAPWNKSTASLSGIAWGSDAEQRRLEADFERVQKWSKEQRRPIFLGEFGAYDKADMSSRVRYTACVARAAEAHGWAWAYWQFDSDFIAFDIAKDDWVQPIWKALVP